MFDYELLRKRIFDCSRYALTSLAKTNPDEQFYVLELYSDEDGGSVGCQINSLDALTCTDEDPLDADVRWRADCKYEASEYFQSVNDQVGFHAVEPLGFDDQGWTDHKGRVYGTMVNALCDLRKSQVIQSCQKGPVVLVCSITDSEWTAWLEKESSTRCNTEQDLIDYNAHWLGDANASDPVFQSFLNQVDDG